MSKQANPTVIGAFVVGAVILIATAFALFGGAQIFAAKNRYIAVFAEPTNGLRVGANVMLNGVRVGYVSDIDLIIDDVSFETDTQVVLELINEDIKTKSGDELDSEFAARFNHERLIQEAGLRASLQMESFVTGQLSVALQLRPETEAVMRAVDPPYDEIPTVASNVQELLNNLQSWFAEIQENVDFRGLSQRLNDVLQALDDLARSEDMRESIAGINRLINDAEMQQLAGQVVATLEEMRQASSAASNLFSNTEKDVDMLVADLQPALKRLAGALDEAEQTLAAAKSQLKGDSEQFYQLGTTLDELERAARSVREYFDYMERNPEAFLQGKSK
ncbi:MAG: MlaD family protein [Gammaproteobacteria bacterium]|jgi:paraquat-inducible protein B|nr:MlaD family protein [Gammaproteobacteria bacterium]